MGESRIENILEATINGEEYTEPSGSRIETLLIELNELIGGGGSGSSTAYATALSLSIDSSTYVMTAQLLNKDGDPLGTAQTVDLPLESVVVGATYDNTTKSIILTLQSGSTTSVPVGDLVAGLVTTSDLQTALATKQHVLTPAQLAAVNSGITEAMVRQYDDIYAVLNYSNLNHNVIFRGKDLTNVYTIEQMYERIHNGTFEDLYLGDYFTKSITTDIYTHFTDSTFDSGTVYYEATGDTPTTRTWAVTEDATPQSDKMYATKLTKTENITLMFAAFDYYYNMGDTALTTHHAILIPKGAGFATAAKMNPTNTTAGGYYGSDMHQITLPCYAKSLKTMLGNHLLSHKTWLTTTVNTTTPSMAGAGMTGAASASAWEVIELQLMNEVQLYGSTVWSSSAYDVGVDNKKLPVFNFINPVHFGRIGFWLRSVVSSTNFAYCSAGGYAYYNGASYATSMRPLILFG